MNQTRLESMVETFMNYLSGFILAFLIYKFVVIPAPLWLKESAFLVTMIFTVVSIIRTYFWRRFFNKQLHKAVHNWTKLIYKENRL